MRFGRACRAADVFGSRDEGGAPKESQDAKGQFDVPLTFKNTSARTCGLHGVPGVDLIGPDDSATHPGSYVNGILAG
ncbi:DUF4232 domain-containing protein [Amycolatopsis sp. NBC_01307]|uniref:DUF4232 domain-containing protein n=1 Tax=Amycolatopsis sp. NBC_01307 TaxID=2903561 RepID=UPI002E13640B|nr:DUF4232 domain-containing protein [Amycolatopsis sp. NBC_01307]